MKISNLKSLCAGTIAVLASISSSSADIIAAWETTGQTGWGIQGLPTTTPSFNDPNITTTGLTRGAGVATTNTAVANGWGGHGWDGAAVPGEPITFAEAVAAEQFITFSFTPNSGFQFAGTTFSLNYRRSGTGPTDATLQYSTDGATFSDVGTFAMAETTGGFIDPLDLSGVVDLPVNNYFLGKTITFRLVPFGARAVDGTFYIWGPGTGFDLAINGKVATDVANGGLDDDPPLVAGLSPADNATNVSVTGTTELKLIFNEDVTNGTGPIFIKKVSDNSITNTIDSANVDQVSVSGNEFGLIVQPPLVAGTAYYVEFGSGRILDTAGNSFAGFAGNTAWNFTTSASAANPTVVVNKFLNSTPDRFELLVIKDGIPGQFLNMRGMVVKDFSSNNVNDGGGQYLFNDIEFWSQVPVGTLITVSNVNSSPDILVSPTDFKLSVGLTDPNYFTKVPGSGTFDISGSDTVAIKQAGSVPAGVVGGIHALGSGNGTATIGQQFADFPGAKNYSTLATSGSTGGIIVNNSTSTVADFNPGTATGATGAQALTLSNFGAPNNGTNAAFIASLRGLLAGDGDGTAVVTNATAASPFAGLGFFDNGVSSQSAKVAINAQIPGVTITSVRIVVPAELGTPSSVVLSGAGSAGASSVISTNVITISAASATTANPLEVTINGLVTPNPTLVTENGNYPLTVSTSANGGTLTPINIQPAVRVIIPISSLRDVDAAGVALDAGTTVAVEGVATEENFGTTNTQAFIQDATAGINIFCSSNTIVPVVRGNRYIALGNVLQFNGLTEIVITSAADLFNLGADVQPAPEVVTLAALAANPETYEGKLIKVENLAYFSGSWMTNTAVLLDDAALTRIRIWLPAGSSANSVPASYPINVAGIYSQSDSSSPFNSGYELIPRDVFDITPGTAPTNTYASWISGFNVGTQTAKTDDFDNDGLDNAVENYLGTNPSVFSPGPTLVSGTPSSVTFRLTRSDTVATDLVPSYEWSTNLTTWTASGPGPGGLTVTIVTSVVTNGSPNDVIEVVSTVSGGTATKLFVRLKVL